MCRSRISRRTADRSLRAAYWFPALLLQCAFGYARAREGELGETKEGKGDKKAKAAKKGKEREERKRKRGEAEAAAEQRSKRNKLVEVRCRRHCFLPAYDTLYWIVCRTVLTVC